MSRVMRGLAALVALVLGLGGLPFALLVLGGNPLPESISWVAFKSALFSPDDGTVLLGLITLVGWAAWLVFAVSVTSEFLAVVSQQRIRVRLPGLGGPQRFAAGLVISAVGLLSVPHAAAPAPAPTPLVAAEMPAASPPRDMLTAPPPAPTLAPQPVVTAAGPGGARPLTHVVEVGDDLWSLAERYYGVGRDWRRIATANPHVLSGGPDRLRPGWKLTIPDVDEPLDTGDPRTVTVRRGDTLSGLAERELGSAARWRELFRLNRTQLSDPDELPVGLRLVIPDHTGSSTSGEAERAAAPPAKTDKPPATAGPQSPSPPAERPPGADDDPVPQPAPATSPATPPGSSQVGSPQVEPPQVEPSSVDAAADLALPLAGIGGLLAAGLLGGLALRRRMQLQQRPLGRRIAQPPPPARAVEVALGRRQRPLSLRTLDRAGRAIAAHCRSSGTPLPPLLFAYVADDQIELVFSRPSGGAPVGFTVRGRSWFLSQADAGYLETIPELSDACRPWPALVTLGRDAQGRQVVADLEAFGLLQLSAERGAHPEGVLAAMAVELSFSPWADEMILTLVGSCERLPGALGKHNVTRTDDLDGLLTRLEQRARAQREHQPHAVLGQHRIDPDLADPWAPEIVLVNQPMSRTQRNRLDAVVSGEPRVTMAAVVVDSAFEAPWLLRLTGAGDQGSAVLEPGDLALVPHYLDPPSVDAVVDLVAATGSQLTTPAPWWAEVGVAPDPPPDNVAFLDIRVAGGGTDMTAGEGAAMQAVAASGGDIHHPILQLIGPIELLGAAGNVPPRAGKQCLEYCAWLLEHPRMTALAMATALVVAEGTRRSNMSRLRTWLGNDSTGAAYLPDAYTGRIVLHSAVSSDWQRLQILTVGGVNRASSGSLRAALDLVRGAPLADAAPGQWHWAEELRTDMISCLRDIGVELADRALEDGDLDLARWAAARALVAAPGDELLMAARIRTEHLAGNPAETERLTLQLAAQSRSLGIDLDAATVTLLQQVMEGRARARMA